MYRKKVKTTPFLSKKSLKVPRPPKKRGGLIRSGKTKNDRQYRYNVQKKKDKQ